MKPQLIVADFSGKHNAKPEETGARLLKGVSWRKERCVVILPAAATVPAVCALSWINLAFPPNNGRVTILAQGMEVGDAYSSAIEQILGHPEFRKWEYILTIESDNAPNPDGVIRLMERMEAHPELACISGLYFTKGENGEPQIWGDITDPLPNFRPQIPREGELIECYGTGMGFALWRMKMFRDGKIPRPWFETHNGKDGKGIGTQDLSFWSKAHRFGYRCAVDCAVRVGHYDLDGAYGPAEQMW